MQVTFKTITDEEFQLDLSVDLTIDGVKQAIANAKGENFAVEYQTLKYHGKVLADEVIFSDIGYSEKKFIVLIVKKPENPAMQSEILRAVGQIALENREALLKISESVGQIAKAVGQIAADNREALLPTQADKNLRKVQENLSMYGQLSAAVGAVFLTSYEMIKFSEVLKGSNFECLPLVAALILFLLVVVFLLILQTKRN